MTSPSTTVGVCAVHSQSAEGGVTVTSPSTTVGVCAVHSQSAEGGVTTIGGPSTSRGMSPNS